MSNNTTLYTASDFILLSLPANINPTKSSTSNDTDSWLQNSLIDGKAFISNFNVPEFKIGSLDSLIVESEELAKIDGQLQASISKIIETLSSLHESNTNYFKTIPINNVPLPEYLENFHWDTRKFKLDKSIKELIGLISNESFQLDSDVKASYANYNNAKTNLIAAERKKTGDLSVRSLHDIVSENDFVLNSEHLTTILVAVPKNLQKTFEQSYEKLTQNVVPGSATILSRDSEYLLYNVHLFKKNLQDFINQAREKKFIPREFNYSEKLIDDLKREHDSAASLENSLRIQLVRLSKTAYVDIFINWFHIKALRIFVESVLRYGLPPHFNTKIIAVPPKFLNKCKAELIDAFGFLGGSAFTKNKKGKINEKDTSLHQYASLVDTEYDPFVIYLIKL
ncbi:hypothetical protein KAFR_0C04010 [Kazachstania africana CBS 2517]|uniref:V-type proton ATPase subunit C n=1 Tax=Kazachstania africana (strain ATCC 22294 / BCRC 22015 / CBS 2517 / CECT 1963 / NBRC 1671 / NRRL Y-8276) TaxID=1071382 RepID=H2ASP2_KAZAF|nr:hypothetical protein KAFR_0C04010 [Kazachstania africana CBS 2517]CCF57392.1 hypothetical protein KAFR_0C04010 [Kazachstania africana CBS 2517]